MPITYNAGTNIITITGYIPGTECAFLDIYNADIAGGWGVSSKNNDYSFAFDAQLQIGNDSNQTYFKDTNKLVTIKPGNQHAIYIKRLAQFQLGEVYDDSLRSTGNGCTLLKLDNAYKNIIQGSTNYNAAVRLYSSSFYSNVGNVGLNYIYGIKAYNCLLGKNINFGFTSGGTIDYCIITDPNFSGFYNTGSTIDHITAFKTPRLFAASYGYPTNISNTTVYDNTLMGYVTNRTVDVNLINVTSNVWTFAYNNSIGIEIWRKYTFDLHVKKSDKTNFSNRPVTIWQRAGDNNFVDGDKLYEGTTDGSGNIPTQTLIWGFYDETHGNTLQQYYHKILIEGNNDYLNYETEFNSNKKRTEDITLVDVSDIVTKLTDIQTDLDDVDQYKADVMKLFPFAI